MKYLDTTADNDVARIQRNSMRSALAIIVLSVISLPAQGQAGMPPQPGAPQNSTFDRPYDNPPNFDTPSHAGKWPRFPNPPAERATPGKAIGPRKTPAASPDFLSPTMPLAGEHGIARPREEPSMAVGHRVHIVSRPKTIHRKPAAPPVVPALRPTLTNPSTPSSNPQWVDSTRGATVGAKFVASEKLAPPASMVPIVVAVLLGLLAALGYAARYIFGVGGPSPGVKVHLDRGVVATPAFADGSSNAPISFVVSPGSFATDTTFSKVSEAKTS